MIKGMKSIIFLLMLTVVFNLFSNTRRGGIVPYGKFPITKEGIRIAVFMAIRLTMPDYRFVHYDADDHAQQPDGRYGKVCWSLLKVIRLPVHEVAMMMSIALRFIPILIGRNR